MPPGLRFPPLLVAGLFASARLAAQDIVVGDPVWFSTAPAPTERLRSGNLKPEVPAELQKSDEIGFAIVSRHVDENGKVLSTSFHATHPPLERVIEEEYRGGWTLPAVRRDGKRIDTRVWIPVIFNPKSAAAKGADATPRLLAAAPAFTSTRPAPAGQPPVVKMKLSLDATGAITAAEPVAKPSPNLLAAVREALNEWKFAPARQGGQPVAAEIVVPVLCSPMKRDVGNYVPARLLESVKPEYPLEMRRFGVNGSVIFSLTIDAEGRVTKPVIVESDFPAFDEPAMLAVRQWKYQPAMRDGKPVSITVRQPVLFSVTGGTAAFRVSDKTDQSKLPPELRYDTAPNIRGVALPVYPHALRVGAVRGKAKATMLIDPLGAVRNVKILEADRPEFGLALAAALQGWKFDPAYRDGKPVPHMMTYEQAFNAYDLPDEPGDDLIAIEKKSPEKIVSQAKLDAPLKIVSQREARFPVTVPAGVMTGEAVIECLIDRQGRVRLPRIKSASDDAFGYAAVQAAAGWWFEPPLVNGKPVIVREEIPFTFSKNAPVKKSPSPAKKSPAKKESETP